MSNYILSIKPFFGLLIRYRGSHRTPEAPGFSRIKIKKSISKEKSHNKLTQKKEKKNVLIFFSQSKLSLIASITDGGTFMS